MLALPVDYVSDLKGNVDRYRSRDQRTAVRGGNTRAYLSTLFSASAKGAISLGTEFLLAAA